MLTSPKIEFIRMKQILGLGGILIAVTFLTIISCKHAGERTDKLDSASWAMFPFRKVDSGNPVLTKGTSLFHCPVLSKQVMWDEKDVFNPAAVVRNDTVFLLFRAEDTIGKYAGTSRIGLAHSIDGLHFTKLPTPVLFPDNDSLKHLEWEGGIEDPRVVESETGEYVMTYTSYDGQTARLMLAFSDDLRHWNKYGRILGGKYKDHWSKSGAIVSGLKGDKVVAAKINGLYWMYFGDTDLFLASSPDLKTWTPLEENGKLKSILQPRPGKFDSRLVESGPYALLNNDGILLIYNGMNKDSGGDSTLTPGTYCGGQVLFSKLDPAFVIARMEFPFICPDKPYELEGQVNRVCFLEGMVYFKKSWMLYYGTADSRIAVAVH